MKFTTAPIPKVTRTVTREPSVWTDLANAIVEAMPDASVEVAAAVVKETAPSLDLTTATKFVEAVRRVVGDRATVRFIEVKDDEGQTVSYTLWGVPKITRPRAESQTEAGGTLVSDTLTGELPEGERSEPLPEVEDYPADAEPLPPVEPAEVEPAKPARVRAARGK